MSHSGSLFAFLRRVFCVSPIFSSRPHESMCMGLSTARIVSLFEGDQCSRLAPALDSQGSYLFGLFSRSGGGGSFLLDSRVLSIHLCLRLHFMSSFQVFICVDSSHYPSCYPCLSLSISLSLFSVSLALALFLSLPAAGSKRHCGGRGGVRICTSHI